MIITALLTLFQRTKIKVQRKHEIKIEIFGNYQNDFVNIIPDVRNLV